MTYKGNPTQYYNYENPINMDCLYETLKAAGWGIAEINAICIAVRDNPETLTYEGNTEACPRPMTLAEYVEEVSRKRGLGLDPYNLTMADWPTVTRLESEYRSMCNEYGFEYKS